MSREFKQTFFTSLMAVLLVVSNLLCLKLTSLLDLTVAVSVFVYPFTFLCTLLIINLGGKKAAYRSVIIASLIQVFITISYYLAVKLGVQTQIPDMASEINAVFKVNELNIFASIISFITSNCVLIYIYDSFKRYGKELFGIALGLLAALFLNVIIYQLINLQSSDIMFVVNTLLSNIIVSLVMLIIITVIFYLLKEPDRETVEITNMNIDINKYKSSDLAIEDVMFDKKVEETKKTTTKKTKSKNQRGSNYRNASKNGNTAKRKPNRKNSKSSQKNVKSER